jgi:hypothetical protein
MIVSRIEKLENDLASGELRGRMERRIAQWRSEGFDTSSLEILLDRDIAVLQEAFDKFRHEVYQSKDTEFERLKDIERETIAKKESAKEIVVGDVK